MGCSFCDLGYRVCIVGPGTVGLSITLIPTDHLGHSPERGILTSSDLVTVPAGFVPVLLLVPDEAVERLPDAPPSEPYWMTSDQANASADLAGEVCGDVDPEAATWHRAAGLEDAPPTDPEDGTDGR